MKKAFCLALLALSLLTGARAARAAETADYTVIAGDVLQISVWKEDGMDREVLVLPNGDITFPLAGTMKAEGLTLNEVQDALRAKLKKYIPDAHVTASVKAALGHAVSVIGQVAKPGEFIINRRMTALQALSLAGGLTPYASEGNIIIVRHKGEKSTSIPVPYDDLVSGDELDKDVVLEPGDVVIVPTASLL